MATETKKVGSAGETGKEMTTKKVADFVVETGYRQIPEEAIKTAKDAILDSLGCALAGATDPAPEMVTEYVKELGGKPEAGVIAKGFKTSPPLAALINGTMAHVLDYDDVAMSWWGLTSYWEDLTLRAHFLNSAQISDIGFCILYESAHRLKSESDKDIILYHTDENEQILLEDFDYLADAYFDNPQYLIPHKM